MSLENMSITILDDPDKKVRPDGAIRGDVAWKLFLPDAMGDVSVKERNRTIKLAGWLWDELSERLGSMRRTGTGDVFILTPQLTYEGMELVIRLASMWSDEVYVIDSPDDSTNLGNHGDNRWMAPVINLNTVTDGTPLQRAMTIDHHDSITTFLMPALGTAKSFMRTYRIKKGMTYSRLHSHSAVEEHYIVLEGTGTLRYGKNIAEIREGDIVSKPVGPDNYSQFIADHDSELRILDIEVWPDTTLNAKDVVLYPDHREIFLRGQGWRAILPSDTLMDASDFNQNYDNGYERMRDGTWKPKNLPGVSERSE